MSDEIEKDELMQELLAEKSAGQAGVCEENVGVEAPKPLLVGKFEGVEELAKAYESLQSEFTRKCQQLSQMQQGKPSVGEKVPEVANGAATRDEIRLSLDCDNLAPSLREAVIKDYLTSVAFGRSAPAVITTAREFACGAKPASKSIRDMKSIAENFFKTKEK